MQRVHKEIEIVQWFSALLKDPSLSRLDDLRSGAHLVQLVHSMNPAAFDLSRCDFLASTPYHFEKNFKLFQSVMPTALMPQTFVIERLMEGERQRDLFTFCAYVKVHYDAWKHQIASNGGSLPAKKAYIGENGESVLLPQKRPPAAAESRVPEPAAEVTEEDDVKKRDAVALAQDTYDALLERVRAKDRRKQRSRPPLASGSSRRSLLLESSSIRSGSDATSIGVHSAFSYHPSSGAPSRLVGSLAAGVAALPTGGIENWARQVQTPTRGSASSGGNSPVQATPQNDPGFAARGGDVQDEGVEVEQQQSSESLAPPPPMVFSDNHVMQRDQSRRDCAPLQLATQHFSGLQHFNLWALKHETDVFLSAVADLQLTSIVDIDGEGIASNDFVSFEELMLRKHRTSAAVPSSMMSRSTSIAHALSSSDGHVSPSERDAWDMFDELVLEAESG